MFRNMSTRKVNAAGQSALQVSIDEKVSFRNPIVDVWIFRKIKWIFANGYVKHQLLVDESSFFQIPH